MSFGPVRLETDRLLLRLPLAVGADVEEAAAQVAAFQSRNREHFGSWDPRRAGAYFTAPYWADQLRADDEELEDGRRYRFFVSPADTPERVVGFAHFSNVIHGAFWACHLGFGVDRDFEGVGLMHEALGACIDWIFEEAGLHRIEANHRPENQRSAALLRRLGFVPQGYARDYLRIDGAWRDHVLTALTNERWAPTGR